MFLLVDDKGRKYWRQKYRRAGDGKEDTLAHGVYPDTTLAEAREKRDAAKKLIKAGVDPKAQRRDADAAALTAAAVAADHAARPVLFTVVAEAYFERAHRPWSSTHRRDVRRMLDNELIPALGEMPMREIKHSDVQTMLDKITARDALTFARDVRMYFRAIVKHFNGHTDEPITDPSLRVDLPDPATGTRPCRIAAAGDRTVPAHPRAFRRRRRRADRCAHVVADGRQDD